MHPAELWKKGDFSEHLPWSFLMVYYFLAFSILSGTSLLLTVDNLQNIIKSFSVCLWCMAEKFETLNENRSLCRAGIIV